MPEDRTAADWKELLRAELAAAMKRRDRASMTAYRTALGAIDNAESVLDVAPATTDGPIAGAVSGLGATEVARRSLTPGEIVAMIRSEIDEWRADAARFEELGEGERAVGLRQQADVLEQVASG